MRSTARVTEDEMASPVVTVLKDQAELERELFGDKRLVMLTRTGPAFTIDAPPPALPETPYQRKLETALAIIRSGVELLIEAEHETITEAQYAFAQREAMVTLDRVTNPDGWEADRDQTVVEIVRHFSLRSTVPSRLVEEITREAVSTFKAISCREPRA